MVAPDHDGGGQLARGHHLVELQTGEMPLPVTEPADPRGQPFEATCSPAMVIQRRRC